MRRLTVGWVGGAIVVGLVTAAVLVVSNEQTRTPMAFDPALVATDGAAGLLGVPPDLARGQIQLGTYLDAVPDELHTGEVVRFRVGFDNRLDEVVRLDPCPTYRVSFLEGPPGFPPGGARRVLVQMVGRFRCEPGAVLEPGEAVLVELSFPVEPIGLRAARTEGSLGFELWPTGEVPVPRVEVAGLFLEARPRGLDLEGD